MDGLAISWIFRGLFFAFVAGTWVYGLRNSRSHWTRWYGFSAAIYLALIPIWQVIESPNPPHTVFSDPLIWAIGAAWGVTGGFMLILLKAIRDTCLNAGVRRQLRAITNGKDEGVNAA